MSLVVNTNIGSLNAQRSLASSSNELATAMERLSSGKKINSAADDAAGFAIAERMTAQVRGLNMATKNANDGLSMLAVIENATNDVTDMLQRMRELAVQAANDTNSATDRGYLQKEADALLAEINRVASQTQYNGQTVLDGSYQNKAIQVGTDAGQTISFSVAGIDTGALGLAGGTSSVGDNGTVTSSSATLIGTGDIVVATEYSLPSDLTFVEDSYFGPMFLDDGTLGDPTGFGAVSVGDYVAFGSDTSQHYEVVDHLQGAFGDRVALAGDASNVSGQIFKVEVSGALENSSSISSNSLSAPISAIDLVNNASGALAAISSAIEQVSGQRAEYGALQNRLEYTVSNLMNVSEFTTAARSRIEDADFAAESARLAKAQVLQQTGTAMLAQANASSQLAISLIR
jgi:flagellin